MKAGQLIKPRGSYHLGGNVVGGDPATYEPELWQWLYRSFGPKTMLDVGCGLGRAMLYFESMGCRAYGIDGLEYNARAYPRPIIVADLTKRAIRISGIDLVWSCEVAEHIPEQHVQKFIKTLLNGKIIAMSAAGPNDGGWHHRTCRPQEFWIDLMTEAGCALHTCTDEARGLAMGHFRKRGMLFINMKRNAMIAAREECQLTGPRENEEAE